MITYRLDESVTKKRKAKKILKKSMKLISRLPKRIFDYIFDFNITINIGNVLAKSNQNANGYIEVLNENNPYFNIFLDENLIYVRDTLYHELGHLIDMTIGCSQNNKEFKRSNLINFTISKTNKELQDYIKIEDILFIDRPEKFNSIKQIEYDYGEAFANNFQELVTGEKYYRNIKIKHKINELIKEFII